MNSRDPLSVASDIAREAGEVLRQYADRSVAVEYKGRSDIVTAADRASEQLVVERLRAAFPHHSIVAEEGGGVELDSDYVWHVDPLDGTTNFAHGLPIFAVSIGLAHQGQPAAGVVYDPMRDECFAAEAGAGAYLNNRRLRVSQVEKLAEGLFGTGFPPALLTKNSNVRYFHAFSVRTHGARRTGSAALDLCSVASGRLEGFWEFGLKSWDVAAGLAVLQEAGGRFSDMTGGPYALGGPHLATSNSRVHDEMIDLFGLIGRGEAEDPPQPRPLS